MRQKRAKTYKKLMSLYSLSFAFRQPYQVLVDPEICRLAVVAKTDLPQQLSVVLQGTVKPMITQCCIHELYLQGKSQQPAVDLAKSLERRKCNHREVIPGDECIASVVGKSSFVFSHSCRLDATAGDTNRHRYVIATQSKTLRAKLRVIPAVPIVHINRAVMILEPLSDATSEAKRQNEEMTFQSSAMELVSIRGDHLPELPRKRKGPKGPNPLSVKKKIRQSILDTSQKRKRANVEEDAARKCKRRRKHTNTVQETKDSSPSPVST